MKPKRISIGSSTKDLLEDRSKSKESAA
jgi:molecular chaperone IbpA